MICREMRLGESSADAKFVALPAGRGCGVVSKLEGLIWTRNDHICTTVEMDGVRWNSAASRDHYTKLDYSRHGRVAIDSDMLVVC